MLLDSSVAQAFEGTAAPGRTGFALPADALTSPLACKGHLTNKTRSGLGLWVLG